MFGSALRICTEITRAQVKICVRELYELFFVIHFLLPIHDLNT